MHDFAEFQRFRLMKKEYLKKPNERCRFCGGPFYKRPSQMNHNCCSQDCKQRLLHKNGKGAYWKCIQEERNIPSLAEWVNHQHNFQLRTIADLSNDIGMSRISLMRFCKRNDIKTRSISEDNFRRYATMTRDQIKEQTKKANIGMRSKMKDDTWKAKQIKKVLSAQNYRESKPEKLLKKALIESGISDFIPQYQFKHWFIDMAFPDKKIAVEVDGEYWHSLPRVIAQDKLKDRDLLNAGWIVIRIPASRIEKESALFVSQIMEAIA